MTELAPLRVEGCGWLCGHGLVARLSLPFRLATLSRTATSMSLHSLEFGFVADGLAVAGNDDRIVSHPGKIGLRGLDRPVDASARGIIDERIDAVPKRVAGMQDVCLREHDRDVTVRVGRPIMLKFDRLSVELQLLLFFEDFARDCASGRREEIIVPVLDPLDPAEVLLRIAMRNDLGAYRMKPFVAIGVIEVPVRVHEMSDRVGAKAGKGPSSIGSATRNTRVDEDFAVRAGEDRDVPAGAFQHADVVPQLVGGDRRGCGAVFDQANETRASANASRGVSNHPWWRRLHPQGNKSRSHDRT